MNAKVQEGEVPGENPKDLLPELEKIAKDLTEIIQRINKTNAATLLDTKETISNAIASRDTLKLKHSILRELAKAAVVTQDRYSKSEVKFKSTINISDIQKRADTIAEEHREIDARIQEANWRTELL